jgi:hypothetical protein
LRWWEPDVSKRASTPAVISGNASRATGRAIEWFSVGKRSTLFLYSFDILTATGFEFYDSARIGIDHARRLRFGVRALLRRFRSSVRLNRQNWSENHTTS